MTLHRNKLGILLIGDHAETVGRLQAELQIIGTHCRLRTIGAGTSALAYLRRTSPYADVSMPDLIFFDFCEPQSRYYRLLEEIKADASLSQIPLVLLTSNESGKLLTEKYEEAHRYTIFSPVRLPKFLSAMDSMDQSRFLNAVRLCDQLGFVLVQLPKTVIAGRRHLGSGYGQAATA